MLNIGCHLSASKGYAHMAKEAVSINANTFQFFTRNPRGGTAKDISEKDIERAKEIILARERLVKPGRQKLRRPDYFSYKDPIHWYKLNYRYNTAKTIVEDILTALKEGN